MSAITPTIKSKRQLILLIAWLVAVLSCRGFQPDPEGIPARDPETYQPDYWPTYSWRSRIPEEGGLDSNALLKLFDIVEDQDIDLHSLLVIRDGHILLEVHFCPFLPDTKHQLFSATKSVTGTLVGIAIEDGIFPGVDTPVLDLISYRTVANPHEWKDQLTLKHLLTMTSGIEWNEEDLSSPDNSSNRMNATANWAGFVLDQPMSFRPGSEFSYNSGNSVVLMKALEVEAKEHSVGYADRKLFTPLGITDYY
jgi:CubicO group peptidase (beta-lactamase class C family)